MNKYERCVLGVKAKQPASCEKSNWKKKGCYNPWAVCNVTIKKKRRGDSGDPKVASKVRSSRSRSNRVIPKLRKGSLTKYGYSLKEKAGVRHTALKKAVVAYGYSSVIKKLNAVRTLTKNTNPKNSEIYSKDIKYLQNNY